MNKILNTSLFIFLAVFGLLEMECGNDELNLTADINPVPKPATMLLFGTGLLELSGPWKKKVF